MKTGRQAGRRTYIHIDVASSPYLGGNESVSGVVDQAEQQPGRAQKQPWRQLVHTQRGAHHQEDHTTHMPSQKYAFCQHAMLGWLNIYED